MRKIRKNLERVRMHGDIKELHIVMRGRIPRIVPKEVVSEI